MPHKNLQSARLVALFEREQVQREHISTLVEPEEGASHLERPGKRTRPLSLATYMRGCWSSIDGHIAQRELCSIKTREEGMPHKNLQSARLVALFEREQVQREQHQHTGGARGRSLSS